MIGTTVIFVCADCAAIYRTTQVHQPKSTAGRFICSECDNKVHSWIGTYAFFDWEVIEPNAIFGSKIKSQHHCGRHSAAMRKCGVSESDPLTVRRLVLNQSKRAFKELTIGSNDRAPVGFVPVFVRGPDV